ncbi:MAG: hypothetical protein IJ315_09865 [Firmicutes bacterium]|nr:hypothetical protein [Bacillota bacterium]
MVREILTAWDISAKKIKEKERGWWMIDDVYDLRDYKNVKWAAEEVQMLEDMSKCGLPVDKVICTKEGTAYDPQGHVLTWKCKGEPVQQVDRFNGRMFGRGIGEVTKALKQHEIQERIWDDGLADQLMIWEFVFAMEGWPLISQQEWNRLIANLREKTSGLRVQMLDQRMRVGSFLFEEERFSGYVSYFHLEKRLCLESLTNMLVRLLCEGYIPLQEGWLDVVKQVIMGYEYIIPMSMDEKEALVYIMEYEAVLFTALALNSIDRKKDALIRAKVFHMIRMKEAEL